MKDNIRFTSIPCKDCIFLGYYEEYDLFYCPQSNIPTLIRAFIDEDNNENYGSIPLENYKHFTEKKRKDFIDNFPEYIEAYNRAKERGLVE